MEKIPAERVVFFLMPRFHTANNRPSRVGRLPRPRLWYLLLVTAIIASLPQRCAIAQGDAERGYSVFAMAGGCGCHTGPDGPIGAGGGKVPTPFGTFYGTNITSDAETGIGAWTDAQIIAAIRDGWRPDGAAESPAMPYYRYAGMADADLADLIAYLRTLAPVRRANRQHEVALPFSRLAYRAWRFLFFRRADRITVASGDSIARGRYLVDHIAICGDCHTPRTRLGAPDDRYYLAGTTAGPEGATVPNITPDRTGIHDWDTDDIVSVLSLGMLPNFDNVQGLMAEVVDGQGGGPGYKNARTEDLQAIAAYLKTVKPIEHAVGNR
jgi:mono/diheme cytochrome c family protein